MFKINDSSNLAEFLSGELIGENREFKGVFTTLARAGKGDIVIRHWIDSKGVEIANSKNISALITEVPRDDARKTAEECGCPLIIVDKIEIANALALKWTIDKFAKDSKKIVVTGTNGKSTTANLIYHILDEASYKTFTNTDANSELNTLIDPMVSVLILDYFKKLNPDIDINSFLYSKSDLEINHIDFLVVEVSEVQGWLNRFMKSHAAYMVKAIDPDVSVITNISMDHIGLVNSIEEIEEEILNVIKTIEKGTIVLNMEDERLKKLSSSKNDSVDIFFQGNDSKLEYREKYTITKEFKYKNEKIAEGESINGIFLDDELLLKLEDLPFKTKIFISNILSSLAACLSLGLDLNIILQAIESYKSLNRRFSKLYDEPFIIDDFAHNPEGIKLTIENFSNLNEDSATWIVFAIRGSRGDKLNCMIAEAIVNAFNEIKTKKELIITSSADVVDRLNIVLDNEKETFLEVLDKYNTEYKFFNNLKDALEFTIENSEKTDKILLIGAQGMDPASDLLKDMLY